MLAFSLSRSPPTPREVEHMWKPTLTGSDVVVDLCNGIINVEALPRTTRVIVREEDSNCSPRVTWTVYHNINGVVISAPLKPRK